MNKFELEVLEVEADDTPRITNLIDNMNSKIHSIIAEYNYTLALLEELRGIDKIDELSDSAEPIRSNSPQYEGIDSFMDTYLPITERTKLSEVSRKIRKVTGIKKLRPELGKELRTSAVRYRFVSVHNLAFIEPTS